MISWNSSHLLLLREWHENSLPSSRDSRSLANTPCCYVDFLCYDDDDEDDVENCVSFPTAGKLAGVAGGRGRVPPRESKIVFWITLFQHVQIIYLSQQLEQQMLRIPEAGPGLGEGLGRVWAASPRHSFGKAASIQEVTLKDNDFSGPISPSCDFCSSG